MDENDMTKDEVIQFLEDRLELRDTELHEMRQVLLRRLHACPACRGSGIIPMAFGRDGEMLAGGPCADCDDIRRVLNLQVTSRPVLLLDYVHVDNEPVRCFNRMLPDTMTNLEPAAVTVEWNSAAALAEGRINAPVLPENGDVYRFLNEVSGPLTLRLSYFVQNGPLPDFVFRGVRFKTYSAESHGRLTKGQALSDRLKPEEVRAFLQYQNPANDTEPTDQASQGDGA